MTELHLEQTGSLKDNQKWMRFAGLLYLLMIPLGVIGILFIPESVLTQNVETTFEAFSANQSMIKLGVLSALMIQIIQVFLVLALYKILKPYGARASALMVIFTFLAVPIAMLNELTVIASMTAFNQQALLTGFDLQQIKSSIWFLLNLHEQGVMIVHIFWGLWLIPMGMLVYKCGFINKYIGVLLIIGGFGYCVDTITYFLSFSTDYMIAQYTFIGEVLFPVALLWVSFKKTIRSNV